MWSLLFTVVLIVVTLLLYWVYQQSRRLHLPEPHLQLLTMAAEPLQTSAAIPKTIWTYWHSAEQPEVVKRCIAGWQALNPDYHIHVLNADNITDYIRPVPDKLTRLNVAKQTDWIRLELLNRYGGIWLDASIILTASLDWVERIRAEQNTEFVGYYLERYTTNVHRPVVDSWFLAAPAQSRFVADWLALFRCEVIEGDTADYIQALSVQGRFEGLRQAISDPYYHTIHIAAQDVLERAATTYRLALLKAEDSAYALQVTSNWRRKRLYMRLLFTEKDDRPALIKLRGGERTKLESYLKWGIYRKASIAGRYLQALPEDNKVV
ncbi:Capsular polysaccharide synthesis protein [Rheinheimera pacifica]|uniref:Capsular polysaccharide synthesis protein n=1 Tax=Rheinheimera pacifica TaxID=173990 RepID=A0A1H6MZW9_9GAMM|nr:capsular polysaccharide synthesis protein [Rheinheimera pacifica]SEI07783.1 Capsular polysaccharide synthesis protein [Rheinheimera pacifica]